MKNQNTNPTPDPKEGRSIGASGAKLSRPFSEGDETYVETEAYKPYLGAPKGASAFNFDMDYERARALGQSNWEQAGNAVARLLPNTILEIANQVGATLDLEDYANADGEIGNWLSKWALERQQDINEALPIYREQPDRALDVGDFAWWMENGSELVKSATAFVALGYGVGVGLGSLGTLSKGTRAVKWLESIAGVDNVAKGAQAAGALTNAYILNHAEGYGIAVNVFDETYKEALQKYSNTPDVSPEEADRLARRDAARKGENALNLNKANIALNLSSAAMFLKAPMLTRHILKKPNLLRSLKRTGVEGLQESAEETINLIAEKRALADDFSLSAMIDDAFTREGAEAAFLGFLGGAGQTGMTLAGRDLKIRRDSEGNRVSDNQLLRDRLSTQEEQMAKWDAMSKAEKISSVTDAFLNLNEQAKAFQAYEAVKDSDPVKAEQIANKIFANQVYAAFNTGTTERFEQIFDEISKLDEDQAKAKGLDPKTYKQKATEAKETIKSLEKPFVESRGYLNANKVYGNQAELAYYRREEDKLKKEQENLLNSIIQYGADRKLDMTAESVENWKGVQDLPEYAQYTANKAALNVIEDRKKFLVDEYAEITSRKYQNKLKEDDRERINNLKSEEENQKGATAKANTVAKSKNVKKSIKKKQEATPPVEPTTVAEEPASIAQVDFGPGAEQATEAANKVLADKRTKVDTKIQQLETFRNKVNESSDEVLKNKVNIQVAQAIRVLKAEKTQQELKSKEEDQNNSAIEGIATDLANDFEEDFSPASENLEKQRSRINKMLDLLGSIEATGTDITNFQEVGTKIKGVLGEDRFIRYYQQFQDLYNIAVPEGKNNQPYEELFLDPAQEREILANDRSIAQAALPAQVFKLTEQELLEEIDKGYTKILEDQGYKRYKKENATEEGKRLDVAHNTVAHKDKDYRYTAKSSKTDRFNVLNFTLGKTDLNTYFTKNADEAVLDFDKINVGSKVTFKVVPEVVYDDGTVVRRRFIEWEKGHRVDGADIVRDDLSTIDDEFLGDIVDQAKSAKIVKINGENERGVSADIRVVTDDGAQTFTVFLKSNRKEFVEKVKDGNVQVLPMVTDAPIAMFWKGRRINGAYLHLPEWIRPDNVRGVEQSVEEQKARLTAIRDAVIRNGEITFEITERGDGFPLVDPNGIKNKTSAAMPEATLAVGKDGYFKKGINSHEVINKYIPADGWLYGIFPVNKNKNWATPLKPSSLEEHPDYVSTLTQVLQAHLIGAETKLVKDIRDELSIDILTLPGLKQFFDLFVYTSQKKDNNDDFKARVDSIRDEEALIEFTDYTIRFSRGNNNGNTTETLSSERIRTMNVPASERVITKAVKNLQKVLYNRSINPVANRFGKKDFKLPIIRNGELKVQTYDSYDNFIKDHSYTANYSYTLPSGKTIYTAQSTLRFDETRVIKPEVPTELETVEEPIESAQESEEDFDLLAGFEEDFAPKSLSRQQRRTIKRTTPDELDIKGVSVRIQEAIINHLVAEVVTRYAKKGDLNAFTYLDIFRKNKLSTFRKMYEEAIENAKSDNLKKQLKSKLNIVNSLDENYNKILAMTVERLQRVNGLVLDGRTIRKITKDIKEDNLDFEEKVNDDGEVRQENWQTNIFKTDYREKVSAEVKNLLTGIKKIKEDGSVEKTVFGLDAVLPFDRVFNDVTAITAFSNKGEDAISGPNFDNLVKLIEDQVENKPYLQQVVDTLRDADPQTQKQFTRVMSKHYTHHIYAFKTEDEDGVPKIFYSNSDRNSLQNAIRDRWAANLMASKLVTVNDRGTQLKLRASEVNKLRKLQKEIADDPKNEENIPKLVKLFNDLGVDVPTRFVERIFNNQFVMNGRIVPTKEVVAGSSGFIKNYLDRLDALKGKDLLKEKLYENFGAMNTFIEEAAKVYPSYYAHSFKDVRGENYFGYSQNKFIVDRIKQLKTDPDLIDRLQKQPFTRKSWMLTKLTENNNDGMNYLQYKTIDGINDGREGSKYHQMTTQEQELFKVGLFYSENKYNRSEDERYIVNTMYPTLSDKETAYSLRFLSRDFTKGALNGDLNIQWAKALFNNIVMPEARRKYTKQVNPENFEYSGMNEGSDVFLLFPELNMVKEMFEEGTHVIKDLDTDKKAYNAGVEAFKRIVDNLAKKRLDTFKGLGIVETVEGQNNAPSKEILTMVPRKKGTTALQEAYNYEINYLLSNMGVFQLFTTDPANYFKSKHWKTVAERVGTSTRMATLPFYTLEDFQKEHDDTFDNMGKRLAADSAPGEDIPGSDSDSFTIAHVSDTETESMFMDYYNSILDKADADQYKKMADTDAQEYTTIEEHLKIMESLGEISNSQRRSLLIKEGKGTLTGEDLDVILQPMKPRYVTNKWNGPIERRIYIKSSSFPLIKQLTKGLEIDKLREAMHKAKIDRVVYNTAFKVGGNLETSAVFNGDGTAVDKLVETLSRGEISGLPRTGMKIQQQVPPSIRLGDGKSDKNYITNPTQLVALITSMFREEAAFDISGKKNAKGKEVQDRLNENYQKLYQYKFEELRKELGYDPITNTLNTGRLRNILQAEAIERDYPLYDLLAFDITGEGKFQVPLWATGVSAKIQSMLNSIVFNRMIRHRPRGQSYVLGSNMGFKPVIKEGTEADEVIQSETGIVFDQSWLKESGGTLRPMRIERGEVKPAEVIAPFRMYDKTGKRLQLSKYVDANGNIDTSKLDPEVLEMLGFRIPTQGVKSMSYIKIVGFLPEASGDLLLAPSEFTIQMGSDFDIDKLYALMYHTNVTENGKVSVYKGGSVSKTIDNDNLRLYFSVLKSNSTYVQKQIASPLDFGQLKDLADEIYPIVKEQEDYIGISEGYQAYKYNNARAGKLAVGVFSNDMRLMANFADTGVYWRTKKGKQLSFNIGGVRNTPLSYPRAQTKPKAAVIEAFQSLAVDNENEQALHKLNINNRTFGFIRAMAMSGFEEDIISYVLAQPIVIDYVNELLKGATENEANSRARAPFVVEEDLKWTLNTNISKSDLKRNMRRAQANSVQQHRVLDLFQYLSGKGSELNTISTALNSFNSGIGKNLFYSIAKEKQYLALFTPDYTSKYANLHNIIGDYISLSVKNPNVSNPEYNQVVIDWTKAHVNGNQKEVLDKLINDGFYPITPVADQVGEDLRYRKNVEFIKPKTIPALASVYGTLLNNNIWSEFFPYNNEGVLETVRQLKKLKGYYGSSLNRDAELSQKAFNDIKRYLASRGAGVLVDGNLTQERARLFIDTNENKSIATIVKEYKEEGKLRNLFVNRLSFDTKKAIVPSRILYKAAVAENLHEREIYQSFYSMLISNRKLDPKNGIEYDVGMVARDMIAAQLLGNGVQGAEEFIKYIPINYLRTIGYYGAITNDLVNSIEPGIIVKQAIQHNPSFIYNWKVDAALKKEILKESEDGRKVIIDLNRKFKAPDFIAIPDSTHRKGSRLYELNEERTEYNQIPTLGDQNIYEFNFGEPNAISAFPFNNLQDPEPVTVSTEVDTDTDLVKPLNVNDEIISDPQTQTVEERFNLDNPNVFDILTKVTQSNNSLHKVFATAILNSNNTEILNKIKFIVDPSLKVRGSFNINDWTIKVNPLEYDFPGEFEALFLEEVIHAVTKEAILENKHGEVLQLKALRKEAINAVEAMFKANNPDASFKVAAEAIRKKIQEGKALSALEEDIIYPLMNDEEFIGRLFKSKELQKILNQTKSQNGTISIWDRFKNWIRDILNGLGFDIQKGSVLDYSLSNILELIQSEKPSAQVMEEMKRVSPVMRTLKQVYQQFDLVVETDNRFSPRLINNGPEVVDKINSTYSNIEASFIPDDPYNTGEPTTTGYVRLKFTEDFAPKVERSNLRSFQDNYKRRMRFLKDAIDKAAAQKDFKRVETLKIQLDQLTEREKDVLTMEFLADAKAQGLQDMAEISQIFKRGTTVGDAIYIKEITDYWTNLDQLLFTEDDLYSSVIKEFREIENMAYQHQQTLHDIEENYANKVLDDYGFGTTVEDIFKYYKDVNRITSETLDISRFGNALSSNLLLKLKEANIQAIDESRDMLKDLEEREKVLRAALKSIGFTGEDTFDVFRQRDSKGRLTGHLVRRYSADFVKTLGRLKKGLNRNNNRQVYETLLNWSRTNTKEIDLRKIFLDAERDQDYIDTLKEEMGETHYNAWYKNQKAKIDRYFEQKQNFEELLEERRSNNPEQAMATWVAQHSPFVYQRHLKSGLTKGFEEGLNKFRNTDFIVSVPAKEKDYDNNFKTIESNKDIYDFYNYFTDLDAKLQSLLPEKERVNLIYYGIPYLPKTAQNAFRGKGMTIGLAPVKDAIARTVRIAGEGQEDINPITDRPYRNLDISLTKDNRLELKVYMENKTIEYQENNNGQLPSKELQSEWMADKINELSQQKSFDLPAVLRLYSMAAHTYTHKARVEDYMRLVQNIFDRQKENKLDRATNEPIEGKTKEASNSFRNTKAALDYTASTFYGITKSNEGITSDKVYTTEEKKLLKDVEKNILKVESMYRSGVLSEDQYNEKIKELYDIRDSIGGIAVWSRRGDAVLKYVQLKGMGWNFMSGIANIGFGLISNYIEAAGGLHYTNADLNRGYKLVRSSMLRNATFNRVTTPTAKKIRSLMNKWDVLKDASKELYENAFDLRVSDKHKWLEPYNMTVRTEYLNQAPLLIAVLNNKKLTLPDGTVTTYWDALDENGNWDTEKYGPEPTKELTKAKLKLDQLIKRNHGNYDPVSALKIKDKILGRALSQFRTWMFEGFANRFQNRKYDALLEMDVKGRYVTTMDFFKEYGFKGSIDVLKGMVRHLTFGKVFKNSDFDSIISDNNKLDKIDAANLRKLMAEISMYISLYTSYMLLSLAAGEMDDDDKYKKYALNLFINQGIRLKTDILFYSNPQEFRNLMRDLIPAMSIIKDGYEWADAVGRFIQGDDEIKTGVYSGNSRLLRETVQMFPFGTQVYKNINYSVQTFD